MEPVSTRIPADDLDTVAEMESLIGADRAEVLRRLIRSGLDEWREERAIEGVQEHRMTLREAAETAQLSYVEFLDRLEERGIDMGYAAADLERDLERVDGRR